MTYHIPRTPNSRTRCELTLFGDRHNSKSLPRGSFVRPIELCYIPEHVKDKHPDFNNKTHVYCFTKFGTYPIPREDIEEC